MSIVASNGVNGALADYTITFTANTPVNSGDILNLILPTSIRSQKEPECIAGLCLASISCTSERGKLIAKFGIDDADCEKDDAVISFTVKDMTNAPSSLPSAPITAFWTSSRYMDVCEYQGDNDVPYQITNEDSGEIVWDTVSINQDSKDYGSNNQYSIRFTPTNAIPKLGWVSLRYPEHVKIVDTDAGVNTADEMIAGTTTSAGEKVPGVEVYTSGSFAGSDYAFVDEKKRTLYFHSAFME